MPTILLVDDEKLVQRSLEKTLLRAGYEVRTAADCSSGWEAFHAHADQIDLAVLDLSMPDFSGIPKPGAGLDLLRRIRETRPSLPIVVLTAYDEVTKAKDAITLGAQAYFVKGREQGLVELIQGLLQPSK